MIWKQNDLEVANYYITQTAETAFEKYVKMNSETDSNSSCKLFICCSRALERQSRIISAPSNFSHVAHMGPDQGMKALIELPVVRLLPVFLCCANNLLFCNVDLSERLLSENHDRSFPHGWLLYTIEMLSVPDWSSVVSDKDLLPKYLQYYCCLSV